jgi:hypothetical protein
MFKISEYAFKSQLKIYLPMGLLEAAFDDMADLKGKGPVDLRSYDSKVVYTDIR